MRDSTAEQLDDVSSHLAEMLQHADRLLDEWAKFGVQVRAQVEREAATVGTAVGAALDGAVERAIAKQLGALSVEIARLEQRAQAASRVLVERRTTERPLLIGIAAGLVVAIALLAVLVLRGPAPAAAPLAAAPVAAPLAPAPAAAPADAGTVAPDPAGSAASADTPPAAPTAVGSGAAAPTSAVVPKSATSSASGAKSAASSAGGAKSAAPKSDATAASSTKPATESPKTGGAKAGTPARRH